MERKNPLQAGIVILGCDKNTADAEHFAGRLKSACGDRIQVVQAAAPEESAVDLDVIVIFSCAFILDAKTESVEMILSWIDARKTASTDPQIFVVGCLSQRYKKELEAELPEVTGFYGIDELDGLLLRLRRLCDAEGQDRDKSVKRKRLSQVPYAFLKIADGCDRACSYCVIPEIKGRFYSVPREALLGDARALIDSGVREINVVAQDTTAYGHDLYRDYGFAQLLRDLCALPGDFWLRCLYCYPDAITPELIEVIADEKKIVPYLDVPLQHSAPSVLRAMGRSWNGVDIRALLRQLRTTIPGLVLRTTMLVGFPGETEADHQHMLQFMEEQRFEWLGAFPFSAEEGSPAAAMSAQLPAEVIQERWEAVMGLQALITGEFMAGRAGGEELVLIDAPDEDTHLWRCRSAFEAPEVDGTLYLAPAPGLAPGQWHKVRVVQAEVYDLYCRLKEDDD